MDFGGRIEYATTMLNLANAYRGFGMSITLLPFGSVKPGVAELTKNLGDQIDQLTKTMNDVRYVIEAYGAEARATVEDAAYDFAEARGEAQAKVE